MDELARNPNYDLEDSPAAGVKTRTRARRRHTSSKDDEPRPAIKRRRRKRDTVEAKLAAQAGGPGMPGSSRGLPYCFPRTKVEADNTAPPPQTPLFDFGFPQESWLEASESPSPTKSVKFRPRPASFNLPVDSDVPSTALDGRNKPSGRKIFLGPGHISPIRVHYAPGDSRNNLGLVRSSGKEYSFTTTPTPNEPSSDAITPHKSTSGSEPLPPGATSGVHDINESATGSMMQMPLNPETPMDGASSELATRPLPSTPGIYKSPSVGGMEMPFVGLQDATITEWQPAGLLCMDSREPENQYALLVLNQPIENLNMLRLIWKKAFFRIAADGGANRLVDAFKDPCLNEDFEKIGLEVICGDLDSLFSRVKEDALRRGTKVVEDPDQYSTDFTKCVIYLREKVFSRRRLESNIVCLGGLGGRVDQALSQLHHLYMEQQDPHYKNGRIYLLSTEGITFVLKKGKHRIRVHDPRVPVLGRQIGIVPLREPSTITTNGLEWDVTDWRTEFGGQISTSNHVREDVVQITTTGDVLFTINLNFPPGNHEHPELRREISPIISMEDDMFFGTATNLYSY